MPVVKLYANLRKLAGTKEVPITGATVGTMLNELARWNPPLAAVIFENGGLRPHIVITLNGHNVVDLNVQVNEQDQNRWHSPHIAENAREGFWTALVNDLTINVMKKL